MPLHYGNSEVFEKYNSGKYLNTIILGYNPKYYESLIETANYP